MVNKDKKSSETQSLRKKFNESVIRFVISERNIFEIGFFSAVDTKLAKENKYKKITITRKLDNAKIEFSAEIIASNLGWLPSVPDQDKWFALMSLVNEEKRRMGVVTNPFILTISDILKKLDLADSGENYDAVKQWLIRMRETSIRSSGAVYIIEENGEKKRQYGIDAFSPLNRVCVIGEILEDGSVMEHTEVEFSHWQLKNINSNKSFLQLDLAEYLAIKNILAKALIPVLQNWFYPDMVRELGYFEKRYDLFCQFFNITQYKQISQIKRKLKPSFDELVRLKHLRAWDIVKLANNDGYKIVLYLGEKYIDITKFNKLLEVPTLEEVSQKLLLKMQLEQQANQTNQSTSLSNEQQTFINQLVQNFQVLEWKATELVTNNLEETRRQLEAFKYRYDVKLTNKAGWIIEAIKSGYAVPESYNEIKQKEQSEVEYKIRQSKIDACSFCDQSGWLHLISLDNKKSVHKCNHTQELINEFTSNGIVVRKI